MKGQLLHKVFHTLTEAFQNCLRRFPSTVCFVLALTAYLVYLVATDLDDERKKAESHSARMAAPWAMPISVSDCSGERL